MNSTNPTTKIHPLILSSRLLLIVPGVLLILMGIFLFFFVEDPSNDKWRVTSSFVVSGSLAIYASFTTRILTSSEGIKYYYFLHFYSKIPWDEIEKFELARYGDANLIFKKKFFGNAIQLSYFADDWENCELIREIQKYTPHLKVPQWLLSRPKIKFWHRPGAMLLYYIFCIFLAILPITLSEIPFLAPIKFSIFLMPWGSMMGTFGGMTALQGYTPWMNRQRDNKRIDEIGKVARWHYVFPFSGWVITLFLGIIGQAFFIGWQYPPDNEAKLFKIIAQIVPYFQFLLLPYERTNKNR